MGRKDKLHPSHVTRVSFDASSWDEICINCGAHDGLMSWGDLAKPCPRPYTSDNTSGPLPTKDDPDNANRASDAS